MTGLRVAESTVERTTEAAGRDLGDRPGRRRGVRPRRRDWSWHKDAEELQDLPSYVSLDATGSEDSSKADAGSRPRKDDHRGDGLQPRARRPA